jgi:hypothetical protein
MEKNNSKIFYWFSILWIGAMIAHCDSRSYYGLELFVTSFGFFYLINPQSKWALFIICIFQIASCWQQMPLADNHWLFASFVNIFILAYLISQKVNSKKKYGLELTGMFSGIRFVTLYVYLGAVFHKLNTGFFNSDVSCALIHGQTILKRYGYISSESRSLESTGIWGILFVFLLELAIPLLLINRKTWSLGILLGVLFHLSTHMRNFGSLAFATYILFVPEQLLFEYVNRMKKMCENTFGKLLDLRKIFITQVLAFTVLHVLAKNRIIPHDLIGISIQLWMCIVFVLTVDFLYFSFQKQIPALRKVIPEEWFYRTICLLFVLNSFSPYLGLKNGTSLAMWSNLNSTSQYGNHFFMPNDAFKIFSYVDSAEELKESSGFSYFEKKLISINTPLPAPEICRW